MTRCTVRTRSSSSAAIITAFARTHGCWRASRGRQPADFTRAHGRKVADVMTRDVVSVDADAPLEQIVTLMEEHRIKRVPVLQGDRVVGVVSRADLLRALSVVARGSSGPLAD